MQIYCICDLACLRFCLVAFYQNSKPTNFWTTTASQRRKHISQSNTKILKQHVLDSLRQKWKFTHENENLFKVFRMPCFWSRRPSKCMKPTVWKLSGVKHKFRVYQVHSSKNQYQSADLEKNHLFHKAMGSLTPAFRRETKFQVSVQVIIETPIS